MRVMVLVKATRENEAGLLPSTDLLEAMGHFNQELIDAMPGGGELELRPLFEAEDFGEAMTPELREQEEQQQRAQADE